MFFRLDSRLTSSLLRLAVTLIVALTITTSVKPGVSFSPPRSGLVLAQTSQFLPETITLQTLSRFTYKKLEKVEPLPFRTRYLPDPELEWGLEKVIQEGKDGQLKTIIQIIHYDGEEIGQEIVETLKKDPVEKIIGQGTKIIIRETETADGKIRYQGKFHVWATSYDSRCLGCRGLTYSGTLVHQGTIAVDPNIIPLGSSLYVPGYGFGRAEDIGRAIKGNRIDLGFADLAQSHWSARWVDVYVLE